MLFSNPIAYFITFTCYGTWLHGRNPGSVDRKNNQPGSPWLLPDPGKEAKMIQRLGQRPYLLDSIRREIVKDSILETARHREWKLWAVHVRTNHVHFVISGKGPPEKILKDTKARSSRRLQQAFDENLDRKRWTEHGSTIYLWTLEQKKAANHYVLEEQGEKMAWYFNEEGD